MLEVGKVYVMKPRSPYAYTHEGTFQLIMRKDHMHQGCVYTLHLLDELGINTSVTTFPNIKMSYIGEEAPINAIDDTQLRLRLIKNIIDAEMYRKIVKEPLE